MAKKNNEFDNLIENVNALPTALKSGGNDTAGTFRVFLPGLPPMDIEATDSVNAKALYDKFTGVLATANKHSIEKIG